MVMFAYKAVTSDGRQVRGEMDAVNLVDLELRLKRMEMDFINGHALKGRGQFGRQPIPRRELINFCFHLEQLTRAGVPILSGLADLRDSTEHARFREVVAGLVESIEGGRNLSDAAQEYPGVFDNVFCALLRAGETSGNLSHVLREISDNIKRDDELAAFGRKAVIYPAFVLTFVAIATGVALTVLVPQLSTLFQMAGKELPLATRVLIGASDIFVDYWWAILAVIIASGLSLQLALRSSLRFRRRWDLLTLNLPLIGDIRRKVMLARFSGLFSMMYGAGIPIVEALKSAEAAAGNVVISEGLREVGARIGEGRNVSGAFAAVPLFPPLVVRMLRVGENTGALDEALGNVAYFYDRDVRESVERLQAVTEPLLMVLVASLLLGIAIAVLGPVYDIITQLPT